MTLQASPSSFPSKESVLDAIRRTYLIPVVRVDHREEAICAAEAVVLAGHPLVEMTLTVPGALKIIEDLTARFGGELIIGAGTVLDLETCHAAISAGARFIVSPSTDPAIIELAHDNEILSMPGALTPTEVVTAWRAGADLVKIFPAGTAGGPAYLRALKAPFPQINLVPSGGVSNSNLADYQAARVTAVCIGELIFERNALREGRADVVAANLMRLISSIQASQPAMSP